MLLQGVPFCLRPEELTEKFLHKLGPFPNLCRNFLIGKEFCGDEIENIDRNDKKRYTKAIRTAKRQIGRKAGQTNGGVSMRDHREAKKAYEAADWERMESGILSDPRPLRIGFVGAAEGAGTTTAAAAAAVMFAGMYGNTVFLTDETQREGKPADAESLCLRRRSRGRRTVLYKGVNWQLKQSERSLTAGKYVFWDQPPRSRWHACDVLVGVIDPLPSRVLGGLNRYRMLRQEEAQRQQRQENSLLWVQNKSSPAVDSRELERFLKLRFDAVLPLLPQTFFYEAEYRQTSWLAGLCEPYTFPAAKSEAAGEFRTAVGTLSSAIFAALPQFSI